MERLKTLSFIFVFLSLQACSAERIHTMIQENQKQECQTAPNSQYDDCIERANESYDEYSSKRKEVIEDKTKT